MADGDGYFDLRNTGGMQPIPDMMQRFNPQGQEINADGTPYINPNADSRGGGMDWLTGGLGNLWNNFTTGIGNGLSNPALIPALGAAYNQWQDSGRWTDMAERYADRLDPFGGQRAGYQSRLQNAYDN